MKAMNKRNMKKSQKCQRTHVKVDQKQNRNQKKRALSPISLHQGLKTQGF